MRPWARSLGVAPEPRRVSEKCFEGQRTDLQLLVIQVTELSVIYRRIRLDFDSSWVTGLIKHFNTTSSRKILAPSFPEVPKAYQTTTASWLGSPNWVSETHRWLWRPAPEQGHWQSHRDALSSHGVRALEPWLGH